jgi:hypothetical protein
MLSAFSLPTMAQLSTTQPDPLARIREAAKGNTQACSPTGESLCEQVAPKIIANAEGDSPLAENLRRLTDSAEKSVGSKDDEAAITQAVAWGVFSSRDAGLEAHAWLYAGPTEGSKEQQAVVVEIRGREKPDEWVLVGAHLDSWAHSPGAVNNNCDAAIVLEAARDILKTGIRPRRSIRFVLFTGDDSRVTGSWSYARAFRKDLERTSTGIISRSTCLKITGFSLNGRHDLEPGVRESMKPIESLGANHYFFGASVGTDNFDFLLEGVPTVTAINAETSNVTDFVSPLGTPDKIAIGDLKRNAAIVAVTALGIAERAEPIGPRQSRAEIESLLRASGLEQQMKTTDLWQLWESGERGRLP